MSNHSNARPHVSKSINNLNPNGPSKNAVSSALKRRAQSVINDKTIDAETRALIRYGLEINDPLLAELIRRADAGESVIEALGYVEASRNNANDSSNQTKNDSDEEKIEVLTEMICRAGDEPVIKSVALLVLMATLENAAHPKALANLAKHLAFTRCGELNAYGIVEAQIAMLEAELFSTDASIC